MDFNETLEEALDGLWNNSSYNGASELPRKDYQPYSASSGYSYPYQSGGSAVYPPNTPGPENTTSIPWPLNTVTSDISDGFIYILSAMQKMERCVKENPALNDKQREVIKKMAITLKDSLTRIGVVGKNIETIANLAGSLPPQVPSGEPLEKK